MHDIDDLNLNPATGLLQPINYRPSPHCDDRPPHAIVDLIVIHCISLPKGIFGTDTVASFFCGTPMPTDIINHPQLAEVSGLRVSAHLFINRLGELTQFVPFYKRAWHAGQSIFQERSACNDFSIGIELEGTDDTPYEREQYLILAKIIHVLMKNYPKINLERIVGHEHIAPHRKTDPGPCFDWSYLRGMLV